MKLLILANDECCLCDEALRALGQPTAVTVDYDYLTGETHVDAGDPDTPGAFALYASEVGDYPWAFQPHVAPLLPGCYALLASDGRRLKVDPNPCFK